MGWRDYGLGPTPANATVVQGWVGIQAVFAVVLVFVVVCQSRIMRRQAAISDRQAAIAERAMTIAEEPRLLVLPHILRHHLAELHAASVPTTISQP
jgi:hypothetical protein